jgi:hypothetical protein
VRLAVVLAREQGEVERVARQAAARHPAHLGHVHDLGEHVLHRQRGADLDAHARLVVAGVGEAVDDAGRDLDDVAGAGVDGAQADAEAHRPGHDLEALGLDRVDVGDGHRPAGAQRQVEGKQLAAGGRGGVDEGEALARDGVLERLAGADLGGHAAIQDVLRETVHGSDAQIHARASKMRSWTRSPDSSTARGRARPSCCARAWTRRGRCASRTRRR